MQKLSRRRIAAANIFLDRDGVINEVIMRGSTVGSPRRADELLIRKDFVEFYRQVEGRANLFVVSNQPDISRQLMLPVDHSSINELIVSRFDFREVVYCQHDDADGCPCRKPKPGMLTYLLEKFGLDAGSSVLIGDSRKDVLAGKAAGVGTVLLRTAYNMQVAGEADFAVESLSGALSILELHPVP